MRLFTGRRDVAGILLTTPLDSHTHGISVQTLNSFFVFQVALIVRLETRRSVVIPGLSTQRIARSTGASATAMAPTTAHLTTPSTSVTRRRTRRGGGKNPAARVVTPRERLSRATTTLIFRMAASSTKTVSASVTEGGSVRPTELRTPASRRSERAVAESVRCMGVSIQGTLGLSMKKDALSITVTATAMGPGPVLLTEQGTSVRRDVESVKYEANSSKVTLISPMKKRVLSTPASVIVMDRGTALGIELRISVTRLSSLANAVSVRYQRRTLTLVILPSS